MPIIKYSNDLSDQTLEEYYERLKVPYNNRSTEVGKKMLEFLKMINEVFKKTMLWGITSHMCLVIRSVDDWQSSPNVIVSNSGGQSYHFEYLIPKNKQPWKNAKVSGDAKNLEKAKRYLLIAMKESEGWKGNEELEGLLEKNGIT